MIIKKAIFKSDTHNGIPPYYIMKIHHPVIISLVLLRILVERLHYGPYSRYWWQPSSLLPTKSKKDEKNTYFSIRVN